jgi:hypothetical protein
LHFLNGVVSGILNSMHVSRKFESLLDAHRRPVGSRWTGQQLDEATDGLVTRSYFVNLRKGRIRSPGYEKMAAIASAMGFRRGRGSWMAWTRSRRWIGGSRVR